MGKRTDLWKVNLLDNFGKVHGEVNPEDLDFAESLDAYTTVNFDLSLDSPLAKKKYLTPYITDWELYRGDTLKYAGIIVDLEKSDLGGEFVKVACKTYRHYLETRFWPFDPGDPVLFNRSWFQQDVFEIVENILDEVLGQSYSLGFDYNNGLSAIKINYRIEPADNENIYEKINTLSKQEPGFDWWDTPDRRIYLTTHRGSDSSFELNRQNMLEFVWQNKGIRANHLLGLGAGTSSRLGYALDSLIGLERTGRRYERIVDFGTVTGLDLLQNLTQAELDRLVHDTEIVSAEIATDDLTRYVSCGDMVPIDIDIGVTQFTSPARIATIHGTVNSQGDEKYALSFEADSDAE